MLTRKSYYRQRTLAFTILTGLTCAVGCHKPAPPQGPTAEFIEHDDVDPLWQASQSVLRKHDFQIDRLEGPTEDCRRLLDLGVTPGERVVVTHTAPLGDPLVIRIRGASIALRKREAAWIWVA